MRNLESDRKILQITNLSKQFGKLSAVQDLSIDIEKGKITGLIGPNGAGKTTTFNLITGNLRPDSGKVIFNSEDITGIKPYKVARKGIGRSWQLIRIFNKMTVIENMTISAKLKDKNEKEYAKSLLEMFGIYEKRDNYAGELSTGQQKMLSIARILMFDASLMMLDELAAGVNPPEQEKMMRIIHELCQNEGKTFFIIEHDMDVIMNHCDWLFCMSFGKLLAQGTTKDVRNNSEVIKAYFGS